MECKFVTIEGHVFYRDVDDTKIEHLMKLLDRRSIYKKIKNKEYKEVSDDAAKTNITKSDK